MLALASLAATCVVVVMIIAWTEVEAVQPPHTHFPLSNGPQQALLACSAGYAPLEKSESPLAVVQEETDQAAVVNGRFEPLALLAGEGLESAGLAQTSYRSAQPPPVAMTIETQPRLYHKS